MASAAESTNNSSSSTPTTAIALSANERSWRADDGDSTLVEHIAKLLFVRLNPIVRGLLGAAQAYHKAGIIDPKQSQQPDISTNLATTGSNREQCQVTCLQLLRKLRELLDRLQTILDNIATECRLSSTHVKQCLSTGLDSFTVLPIAAVLRVSNIEWIPVGAIGDEGEQLLIVRSAIFQTTSQACQTLESLLRALGNEPEGRRTPSNSDFTPFVSLLPAMVGLLPSRKEIEHIFNNQNTGRTLDRGENCIWHLIHALHELLLFLHQTNAVMAAVAIETTSNGAVLVRMVDCLASLIELGTDRTLSEQCLLTLAFLFRCVPKPTAWQRIFPGIFTGLFRALLHWFRLANQSSRLVILSLETFNMLLTIALPKMEPQGTSMEANQIMEQLRTLKQMQMPIATANTTDTLIAATGKESMSPGTPKVDSTSEMDFQQRVANFLPVPLMVLIRTLLPTRRDNIRIHLLHLLRVILIDTRSYWPIEDDGLLLVAFEAYLVLSQDHDNVGDLQAAAVALWSSQQPFGDLPGVHTIIVSRFHQLVQTLPALDEARKKSELDSALKLVRGYLSWIHQNGNKKLRSALARDTSHESLRNTFAELFGSQAAISIPRTTIPAAESISQFIILDKNVPTKTSSRAVDTETIRIIEETVQLWGQAIGQKRAVMMVDACIADIYESCMARIDAGFSLDNLSQVAWVKSWIGTIQVAENIIIGAFPRNQGRSTHLVVLARNILPIVTSYPLWELPLVSERCVRENEVSLSTPRTNIQVPAAYEANMELMIRLMNLVKTIFCLLSSDNIGAVSCALFPVFEKLPYPNEQLHDISLETLKSIASTSGYSDLKRFLFDHMGSLTGSILSMIRIPGGRSSTPCSPLASGILHAARTATVAFRTTGTNFSSDSCKNSLHYVLDNSVLAGMDNLARELIDHFDRSSTHLQTDDEGVLLFLQLFQSISIHLLTNHPGGGLNGNETLLGYEEPWFELLEPFKGSGHGGSDAFRKIVTGNEVTSGSSVDVFESLPRLLSETSLAALLIARSCYLLSHSSLTVQIQSCEVLIECFRFLSWVNKADIPRDENGEEIANGPHNAILRQVYSSWPSISARMKAICGTFTLSGNVSMVLHSHRDIAQQSSSNEGQKRVFLGMLIKLTACMAECSNDFMARNIRHTVWPCIATVVGSLLKNLPQSEPGGRLQTLKLSPSELKLLATVIDFVRSIFAHRPTGMALAGLIPSAGTLLLPFLTAESQHIADSCEEALRSLLNLDCDSIYRILLEQVDRELPTCRLFNKSSPAFGVKPLNDSTSRVFSLLEFIESLPEQVLF